MPVVYAYKCPAHGEIYATVHLDSIICFELGCGLKARRDWGSINIDAASARSTARYDPQVGQYVESERQFRDLIKQGMDKESESLGREVILETVDARDQEALAELSGQSVDDRMADLEPK